MRRWILAVSLSLEPAEPGLKAEVGGIMPLSVSSSLQHDGFVVRGGESGRRMKDENKG
jgi:hypothetical protein